MQGSKVRLYHTLIKYSKVSVKLKVMLNLNVVALQVMQAKNLQHVIKRGELVYIPASITGHAVAMTLYKDKLIVTNRGLGAPGFYGTQIYQLDSSKGVTASTIQQFLEGSGCWFISTSILWQDFSIDCRRASLYQSKSSKTR